MSLLHAYPSPPRVPVLVPLVQVMIDTDGHLTITVDREGYESEPIDRGDLRRLVDEITTKLENDGIDSFMASYDDLLAGVEAKRSELAQVAGDR